MTELNDFTTYYNEEINTYNIIQSSFSYHSDIKDISTTNENIEKYEHMQLLLQNRGNTPNIFENYFYQKDVYKKNNMSIYNMNLYNMSPYVVYNNNKKKITNIQVKNRLKIILTKKYHINIEQ